MSRQVRSGLRVCDESGCFLAVMAYSPGLHCEDEYPCHIGSCRRGSTMRRRTIVFPPVSCHLNRPISRSSKCQGICTNNVVATTRTVCGDHVGCAGFRIRGMCASIINGRDSDGVYAIRVSIKIALIVVSAPVTARKDKN
jgi:hypothetical protein